MARLHGIEVDGDHARVEAGAVWSEVLHATLPHGRTPPVLTDYLELSIGGTLSAGGVGGATHRHGAQVDNVTELDVVTGTGERLTCSPRRHADLFHAVLSGLGQCAIITRATVRLLPAPATVRHYQLFYPSLAALTEDQRTVVRDARFDYVEGQVQAPQDGSARLALPAGGGVLLRSRRRRTARRPRVHPRHRGDRRPDLLRLPRPSRRLRGVPQADRRVGAPHPWLNVFLPDETTDHLVGDVIDHLTPADIGLSGVILLYPVRRRLLRTPLLRVPDEELVFLFTLLRTASPGAADPAAMVAANRALYERVQAAGGTQYPVGTIPATHADWRRHFGEQWPRFEAAKRRYDPAGILAPGQRVF